MNITLPHTTPKSDHLGRGSWITTASGSANQHLVYLPYGGIFIFRGKDAWSYIGFSAANVGPGWFGVSTTASQTMYFYFGDIDNFGIESFSGSSTQFQIKGGELLIGGVHFNVVQDVYGGFLFGVGPDIGFGVGSTVSGQLTRQITKLHK